MSKNSDTAETLNFIKAVSRRPALWDPFHPIHKNVKLLRKEWDSVGAEMNKPGERCRRKWKNLRDYYRLEIRKIEQSISDEEEEVFVSSWPYFPALSFLRDIIVASVDKTINVYKLNEQITKNIKDKSSRSPSPLFYELTSVTVDSLPKNPKRLKLENNFHNSSELDDIPLDTEIVTILDENNKFLDGNDNGNNESEDEDEDSYFFKSLVPHARKLDSIRKLRFRSNVQNLLMQELGEMEEEKCNNLDQNSLSGIEFS